MTGVLYHGMPYKDEIPKFSTILLEGTKPVLYRYQLLLWTILGAGIYLFMTVSMISTHAYSGR